MNEENDELDLRPETLREWAKVIELDGWFLPAKMFRAIAREKEAQLKEQS